MDGMADTYAVRATPSVPPDARAPAPDAYQTIGAGLAIVLAIAAAIVGYRIIRGGRGL